ncbi:M20/M25/M40 family metallo-hydrolase [Nonlabens tegetincola]|uniref:M20/M25/M40 family metallo-hydrolase n=1 Tax=Nonlabens tegetincola TaxID=323273 RepID=UPI0009FE4CC0
MARDIDALATEFEDDPVAFASKNPGLRHICGHDVHTTIALGIAKNLSLHKEQLVGTYYFVFQPAEETITGAKAMLEDGLLEVIQPDEFYALHMTPFPVGTVAVKPNEIYAHYKKIVLGLHTQDSSKINAATSYFKQLQNVTDERFGTDSSFEDATIGIVGSSSIYKNYTYLESPVKVQKLQDSTTLSAYISFSNAEELEQGRQKMDSLFKNGALQDVYKYHRIEPVSYVIKNHPETTKEAMQFLSNHYEDALTELSGSFPGGRSDDFALFQEEIPGTYFFMGASNFEQNIIAMPHTPIFQVDESVIEYGVRYFSTLLAARANYENIN